MRGPGQAQGAHAQEGHAPSAQGTQLLRPSADGTGEAPWPRLAPQRTRQRPERLRMGCCRWCSRWLSIVSTGLPGLRRCGAPPHPKGPSPRIGDGPCPVPAPPSVLQGLRHGLDAGGHILHPAETRLTGPGRDAFVGCQGPGALPARLRQCGEMVDGLGAAEQPATARGSASAAAASACCSGVQPGARR
jgi:hypothetical protein